MDDWKRTEGAIWDALSSLDEDGEGGSYRGQEYEYHEIPRAKLTEITGLDFRQWWNRRVLEQLVEIDLVVRRVTGDKRAAFYSLPEGMTHEIFFRKKAAVRYEHKLAQVDDIPVPAQDAPVKAPKRHTQPLTAVTAVTPVKVTGDTFVPAKGRVVSNEKLYEKLAQLPTNSDRERLCLTLANYAGPNSHTIAQAMTSDKKQFRGEGKQAQVIMDVFLGVRAVEQAERSRELSDLFK